MKYTEHCQPFPAWLPDDDRWMPRPDLDDDAIDTLLTHMLETGALGMDLPATQYGRRCAVDAMLRYDQIRPLSVEIAPWTPRTPVQPR